MCGICGIAFRDSKRPVERAVLKKMCDSMIHRGPDDDGQAVANSVGLGMRRLSIIDLSTGHQPLSNEDGTVMIVFNGEIYNYREIRRNLELLGHRFRTTSDTESIVHGYEAWGRGVCEHLNGMFAFALWDQRRRKLFLARDRLGIKPLYYYQDHEKFIFGSEIKAILQHPNLQKTIDPMALSNYLTFEYIPSPRSVFNEIRKLEPGHRLTWEAGRIQIEPYWLLEPKENPLEEINARERLAQLFEDSVRLRLVSDVPLGAFLSGGIDSSILVSQMAKLMNIPVKTFSIGFEESSYNELRYARSVAQMYHTDHHEFTLKEADALALTDKLVTFLDEPFGDFSIFPTYLVSKMARGHVTVCLSGDGGDELFAGYDAYRAHVFDRKFYHCFPKAVKQHIFNNLAKVLSPTEKKKGAINSYKRFIEGTRLPKSLLHARWMIFLQEMERKQLLSKEIQRDIETEDPYDFIHRHARITNGLDDITRTGYVDVKTYLVDNILVKVDRMSMATSLEARVPYLDHRIVEFAFSLPPQYKMRGFHTKILLKKTFWDRLPSEVQNRDKQGFSIPIKNWICNELKPKMLELLDVRRLDQQGFFQSGYITQMVDEHINGIENHSHKLWALMVFQQWFDLYGKG
jgi:asparagine synthase (glutamine-hydrolysing)